MAYAETETPNQGAELSQLYQNLWQIEEEQYSRLTSMASERFSEIGGPATGHFEQTEVYKQSLDEHSAARRAISDYLRQIAGRLIIVSVRRPGDTPISVISGGQARLLSADSPPLEAIVAAEAIMGRHADTLELQPVTSRRLWRKRTWYEVSLRNPDWSPRVDLTLL